MHRNAAASLLLVPLLLAVAPAQARSTDRQQPMDIRADRTDAGLGDDSESYLVGNVRIDQGSLSVQAERATVLRAGGEITRITLNGAPVRLDQVADSGEPVKATAAQIVYTLGNEVMVLTGNVRIEQPRGSLIGETVRYNISTGRIDGGGDGRGVSMRILPRTAPTARPAGNGEAR
jgi:lipopolysaccharide export system protein LptA